MMVPESENGSLKNAYTDAPKLYSNGILASLQVLIWLLFHPSAWRSHIAASDPGLRPDFCLAELSRAQWCSSTVALLLLRGYLVGPLTLGLLEGLAMGVLGVKDSDIAFGVSFVLLCGLTFGLATGWMVSLALGLMGVVIAGLAVILVIAGQSAARIIFTGGIALGLVSGLAGRVESRLAGQRADWSLLRRIGRVVLCVVVGGLVAGLALYWVDNMPDDLQQAITEVSPSLAFGTAAGLFFGVSLTIWFAVPYVLGKHFAGPKGGVVVGVVAIGGPLSAVFLLDGSVSVGAILLVWLGVLIGLAASVFLSVLFYPVLALGGLGLYLVDARRSGERPSLLRWHPAFWDEHQPLPWLGLERHLRLVWERDPGAGQAALDYLEAHHPRWAAQVKRDVQRKE